MGQDSITRRDFVASGAVAAAGAVATGGLGLVKADSAVADEVVAEPRPTIENLAIDQESSSLFTIVCLMRRKEGITMEEFKDYYDNHHLPMMGALTEEDGGTGPRVHRRNYVVADDPMITIESQDANGFDVVCTVTYNSREEAINSMTQLSGSVNDAREADEENFLDRENIKMFVVETHDHIGGVAYDPADFDDKTLCQLAIDQQHSDIFKIVCLMKRIDGVTHEEFMDYYDNHHLPTMNALSLEEGDILPLVHRRHYIVPNDPLISIDEADTDSEYDVICEVIYRNRDEAVEAMTKLSGSLIEARVNDEKNFLDSPSVVMFVADCHDQIGTLA